MDFKEVLVEGELITAKDLAKIKDEAGFVDFCVENEINFVPQEINELYASSDVEGLLSIYKESGELPGFPVPSVEGDNLKLESAYGVGKENYVVCYSAIVKYGY